MGSAYTTIAADAIARFQVPFLFILSVFCLLLLFLMRMKFSNFDSGYDFCKKLEYRNMGFYFSPNKAFFHELRNSDTQMSLRKNQ